MELTHASAGAAAASSTARLRGLPLALARLGCIVLAASSLALFVTGLPVQLFGLRDNITPVATNLRLTPANLRRTPANLRRTPAGELTLFPWRRGPLVTAGVLAGDVLVAVDGAALPVEQGASVPPDLFSRPLGAKIHLLIRTGWRRFFTSHDITNNHTFV